MSSSYVDDRRRQRERLNGARPKSARAAAFLAKSAAYQDAADAKATKQAYDADFRRFASWCEHHGFVALPATPTTVGAYLASAGAGYAAQTLRRRVAAIARAARLAGHPLDTKHPAVRETLRGIERSYDKRARRAAALTTEDIKLLCATCDSTMAGVRDRAMLLLGFAGALRRSELVALDVEHLTWTRVGLTVLIARSKTDKKGKGEEIAIPKGSAGETCPVHTLRVWLRMAGITEGPVFRKVNRGSRVEKARLGTNAVRSILLKHTTQAGLAGSELETISPHSLRAGFVTTAYRNGVSDEEIMGHTRHRNLSTMRGYVRRAKLSKSSPAGKIGL